MLSQKIPVYGRGLFRPVFSIVMALLLVYSTNSVLFQRVHASPSSNYAGMFRADVDVRDAYDRARIDKAGIVVIKESTGSVRVLVDTMQRAQLARWGMLPYNVVSVAELGVDAPPLARRSGTIVDLYKRSLRVASPQRAWASTLSARTKLKLAAEVAPDSDGDGLTDTQEMEWCTNPNLADSDRDRTSDKAEIDMLQQWMQHRVERTSNTIKGFPFLGTPFMNPTVTNCYDTDQDAVPDLVEWDLGLDPNRESSDGDKFDDGQELYGRTHCTNSGGFCGYGSLPRNSDFGVIMAEMPAWVKYPGYHPLVAAFPYPEISVKPGSIRVQPITVITTEKGTMTQNERSYATTQTKGTSVAKTEGETRNDWQSIHVENVRNSFFRGTGGAQVAKLLQLSWKYLTKASAKNYGAVKTTAKKVQKECTEGFISKITCFEFATNLGETALDWILPSFTAYAPTYVEEEGVSVNGDSYQSKMRNGDQKTITSGQCVNPNSRTTCVNSVVPKNMADDRFSTESNETQYRKNGSAESVIGLNAYANLLFAPRETVEQGSSQGIFTSLTQTQYEENSVTNGESFTTGEDWRTATALNSSEAGRLVFTYTIANAGTDFALELRDISFNIYLNDDPNPIATYFPATDIGGDGRLTNLSPNGTPREFTSRPIVLSLTEMQALDVSPDCVAMKAQGTLAQDARCPGGTLRIELSGFSYGTDQLFYENAIGAGVTLRIDDGSDDGDFTLDTYVVPTWQTPDYADEPVLDVLARAFPVQRAADGTLVAIWTPEVRTDVPSWCEEPFGNGGVVYCKRALSTADAWLIYSSGMTGNATAYQRMTAQSGAQALFRFRRDSDKDGYPDEVEDRLGTNKNSARSVPMPELTAAMHQVREGNDVTATLSLLNGGATDAYGVEAVMIAPDDSITVTNNFVGGSGRVKAYEQLSVGSQIDFNPALGQNWTANGHTTPVLAGYYTGTEPRTYTFTARCGGVGTCTVGSGSTAFTWVDNQGAVGILEVGAAYQSPNRMTVGTFGLSVALLSGVVGQGEQFTVVAAPPLDTFGYTINREPHTPPLVAVTANHTGGWEQTVVPAISMNIAKPNLNLAPYAGNMLYGMDMQILSNTPVKVGSNTTYIAVNNPSSQTITQGRIYLEVVAPDGYRTAIFEKQLDFVNGPTVVPITWSTSAFTTTYEADKPFIVRATWTDYQDTIIRKAYRDVSNLGVNNFPKIEVPAGSLVKNLGVIDAGMPAKYSVFIANMGQNSLMLTHRTVEHVQSNLQGTAVLPMGAVGELRFSLDTGNMPVGSFTKSIQIRTSDPLQPLLTVQLSGEIVAADSAVVTYIPDPYKPLEQAVYVKGPQAALAPVTYNNAIVTDQARIHPVEVVDDLTGTSLGRGRAVASVWEQLMPVPMATARESRESGAVTVAPRALVDSSWVEVCGVNCDFEYGNMHGWVQDGGNFDVRSEYPLSGRYAVKGTSANQAGFYRDVNISQYAMHVDAGFGTFSTNAWMDIGKSESSAVTVQFLNASMQEIARNGTGWVSRIGGGYGLINRTGGIPSGTRYLRLRIDARRSAHSYTDVDVDSVSLQVRMQGDAVGTAAGTVYADLNQNGVRDVGEPAVSDVQVTLDEALSVRTDAQGGYRFTGVDVGTHQVRIVPPAQYTALSATQQQIAVAINQQTNVDFRLRPYSSVTGSVYVDMDADGVRDAGEQGVAGVVIAAGTQQVSTDADGKYTINGVPTGSLTIGITQSNGYVAIGDASVTKNIGLAEAVQVDFGVLNYVAEFAPVSGGATMRMFVPNAIAQSARYVVRNGIEMSFDGPNVTQTTYVTLPNTEYLTVSLEILSIDTLTGNMRVDVGADGSNDWMQSLNGVSRHVNNALANQVNAFRAGKSGNTINLPIKITSASNAVGGKLLIYNVVAMPKPTVDVSVAGVVIANTRSTSADRSSASTTIPINVTRYVNATIRNNGTSASEPMSVAAVADITDFGAWYVGSVLVPALPVSGTHTVSIPFTTQSWESVTGTIKLLVDPYGGVPESNEANNEVKVNFTVVDPIESGLTPIMQTQTAVAELQTATAIVRGTATAIAQTQTAVAGQTQTAVAGQTQTAVAQMKTATANAVATQQANARATQTAQVATTAMIRTATAGQRQTTIAGLQHTRTAVARTSVAARTATAGQRQTAIAGLQHTRTAVARTSVAVRTATVTAQATSQAALIQTRTRVAQTSVATRTATVASRITPWAITPTVQTAVMWTSGEGVTRLHEPRAGEICYGAQVGKLERRDTSYIVYFASDTASIAITSGYCELYGRSLADIVSQVRKDYGQLTWQVVSDYASAAPRPQPVRWESGPREQSYSPQAGEICWGEYVGRYRQPGTSYVVYFAENSAPITIFHGACERHDRSFSEIVRWVTTEAYPQLRWQVIAPYVSN